MNETRTTTFGDLMLDLGRQTRVVNYAQGVPVLRSDGATVDRLAALLNNASRKVCTLYPDWTWMDQDITLRVDTDVTNPNMLDGDSAYWTLPPWVTSAPKNKPNYKAASSNLRGTVLVTSRDDVDKYLAAYPTQTGIPERIFVKQDWRRPRKAGEANLWIMGVYPRPSQAFDITLRCRRKWMAISDLAEVPFWPEDVDACILESCKAEVIRSGGSPGSSSRAAEYENQFALLFEASRKLDHDRRPRGVDANDEAVERIKSNTVLDHEDNLVATIENVLQ